MAISGFWNFEFLISKIKKLFWEKVPCFSYTIQNFENLKTEYMLKKLVIFNQHEKFQIDMSIFDPQG